MSVDAFAKATARATDVRAASWVAVEYLAGPALRPSVYIERGGRLRCQALLGYRQLLDGLPPWVGVIGRTYATGEPSVAHDVSIEPNYLDVAADVIAEACFPVVCGGRTVGAVNLEATRRLRPKDIARTERAAAALGARIEALGGPLPESAPQRLVRHAIALATQHDTAAIERAVLAAAVDVTPLDSAMLLRREGERCVPGRGFGPLEPLLMQAPRATVEALAGYVTAGCSAYTVTHTHDLDPGEPDTIRELRAGGAASLAVLQAGPDRILVVAGSATAGLSTEHCELLELLAAQASACLRTAASVTALRAQAATDALTGFGHHATFHRELSEAHEAGDLGVLVIDVDAFKAFNDRFGHPAGDGALKLTATALASGLRRGDALFRIGGDEFAALLPGVDATMSLEVARRLHDAVAESTSGLSVSIGAAVSRPGEAAAGVLARADRALYAVKTGGRDGVAFDGEPFGTVG